MPRRQAPSPTRVRSASQRGRSRHAERAAAAGKSRERWLQGLGGLHDEQYRRFPDHDNPWVQHQPDLSDSGKRPCSHSSSGRGGNLGWQAFLSFSRPGPGGGRRGGTAVLLRRALMSSGELAAPTVQRCPRGRYTALSFTWSGHSLPVCSIYLPNAPAARVAYISSSLAPLAAAARAKGQRLLWGGDYNFTPDPHLDRRSMACSPLRRSTHYNDTTSQSSFSVFLPDLVDAWRARRPHRRAFTFTNGRVFARLDRIYVSDSLLPCASCPTVGRAPLADHCPVSVTLLGLQPLLLAASAAACGLASSPPLPSSVHG